MTDKIFFPQPVSTPLRQNQPARANKPAGTDFGQILDKKLQGELKIQEY